MDTLTGAAMPTLPDLTGRSFALLDRAERDRLGTLLRPLAWIDGLITADMIAPSEADNSNESEVWLDHIWRKESAAELSKLTLAETGNIVSVLIGQYAHIGDMLREQPEAYRPYLSGDGDPLDAATQWAGGFRRGIRLSQDAWRPLLDDEKALSLIIAIFGLLPDEDIPAHLVPASPFRHMSADERDRFRRETVEMLPQIVLTLRECVRDHDAARADYAEPYVRPTPKIGRNDSCPCGSGNKYKKCCLDRG